jgi:hypothetical protein
MHEPTTTNANQPHNRHRMNTIQQKEKVPNSLRMRHYSFLLTHATTPLHPPLRCCCFFVQANPR